MILFDEFMVDVLYFGSIIIVFIYCVYFDLDMVLVSQCLIVIYFVWKF